MLGASVFTFCKPSVETKSCLGFEQLNIGFWHFEIYIRSRKKQFTLVCSLWCVSKWQHRCVVYETNNLFISRLLIEVFSRIKLKHSWKTLPIGTEIRIGNGSLLIKCNLNKIQISLQPLPSAGKTTIKNTKSSRPHKALWFIFYLYFWTYHILQKHIRFSQGVSFSEAIILMTQRPLPAKIWMQTWEKVQGEKQ